MPGSGAFPPLSKPTIAQSLAPMAAMAGQSSGGAPPATIVLLYACAMLLLVSGINQNPGPDTQRAGLPTPCDEPVVTPHRRATAKSVSNDTPRNVNINNNSACMQCSKNVAGDETCAFRCGKCGSCLKSAHYIKRARLAKPRSTSVPKPTFQLSQYVQSQMPSHLTLDCV